MRERLNDERDSITRNVNVFGYKTRQILGYNDKGELKEIQLFAAKRGTIVWEYLQVLSLMCSKCLQYNISAESLAKRLEGFVSDPSGMAEGEKFEGFAHYVSWLLRNFKKREEIKNGKISKVKRAGTKEQDKPA